MDKLTELQKHFKKVREEFIANGGEVPKAQCQICKDLGLIPKIDGKYTAYVECECIKRKKARERALWVMDQSGLSDKLKQCTFTSYIAENSWQSNILSRAKEYTKCKDKWFYIGGQSGAGKTHICVAIAGQAIKSGQSVMYLRWRDEGAKLKRLANISGDFENAIKPYKTCDLLYIDDFFKCRNEVTDGDFNLAFELLNHRYDNRLKTIISSESTINALNAIDNAIAGRINEMAKGFVLSIAKDDKFNLRTEKADPKGYIKHNTTYTKEDLFDIYEEKGDIKNAN